MITAYILNNKVLDIVTLGPDDIVPDNTVWLDAYKPDTAEREWLTGLFLEEVPDKEELDDIEAAAAQAMPVRSGKLRASLQRYTNIGHDEVRSGLRMGSTAAPYAYKVKFAKGTPLAGRSVFQELLRKPAVAAIDEVVGELADQVISRPTRGS